MGKNGIIARSQPAKPKFMRGLNEVIREAIQLWRKHHLSYDQSRYAVERVRRELRPEKLKARRRPVARLDHFDIERLIESAHRKGSRYGLIVKTLSYTGARVSEFVNIKIL
jgi:integrase/recombinase XerD